MHDRRRPASARVWGSAALLLLSACGAREPIGAVPRGASEDAGIESPAVPEADAASASTAADVASPAPEPAVDAAVDSVAPADAPLVVEAPVPPEIVCPALPANRRPLTREQVVRKLAGAGYPAPRYTVELFGFLTELGPPCAFASTEAYRVVDGEFERVLDSNARAWEPVLVAGRELLVGPSTRMLDTVLKEVDFFARPEAFGDEAILQLHDFALDYYRGANLRGEVVERGEDQVIVRGTVWGPPMAEDTGSRFCTTIRRGQRPVFQRDCGQAGEGEDEDDGSFR